jgi:hypothetical protein
MASMFPPAPGGHKTTPNTTEPGGAGPRPRSRSRLVSDLTAIKGELAKIKELRNIDPGKVSSVIAELSKPSGASHNGGFSLMRKRSRRTRRLR